MSRGLNLGETLSGNGTHLSLIDLSGQEARSYTEEEFDQIIAATAAELEIEPGARYGLLGQNSAEFVATLFAIMRAGGVAVPMNTKFPVETLRYIVGDAALSRVYVSHEQLFHDQQGRLPDEVEQAPLPALTSFGSHTTVEPSEGQAGMVLYTSGSTGRPKGVLLSHDSQWAMVSRMSPGLKGATGMVAAPLYHMNGLLFLMGLFDGGGTVVLMPKFDARVYLQAIATYKANILTGVPTMLTLMLQEQDLISELDLGSVMAIQVGSAPLSETLIKEVGDKFPNARISNGYGTTEAGAGMFGAHPDGIPVPSLSLGHVQPHVDVRLVGGESEDEGVLEVRTPAAMTEYLNLPDKTADKKSSDGWINTGDLMRKDENGFFYFVGRDDDMFNCGGENIFPGEVERILESDSRVAECSVVPVDDAIKGQKPVAFVVLAPGAEMSEQDVKDVALNLAPAYMHPRRVFFLDVMPLAGTNKIDRHQLTALAAERTSTDGN